jgi:hypothetical protein
MTMHLDDRARIVARLAEIGSQLGNLSEESSFEDRDIVSHLHWMRDLLSQALASMPPNRGDV